MNQLSSETLEDKVLAIHRVPGIAFTSLVLLAAGAAAFGGYCWSIQIRDGLQVTGLGRPVMWASYITNFVFWVGIAHSGTLLSAILYLFRARFRTAVYRVAEAMTVFAVMTAGLFPVIHLGRPWLSYWLFPYPNQRHLWVNFRSPLVWDVFAVMTYFIVSSTFLLLGIVPDAAALRDRTRGLRSRIYAFFAAGWRGSDGEWRHYDRAYLLLAAFATPLVVSVHSVVSWDFAMSILPGWHSTIFPPYFVAGAILSGMTLVLLLLIPLRTAFRLQEVVTKRHLDMLARIVLLASLVVTYSYVIEFVLVLRGGSNDDRSTLLYRATSPTFAPLFWTMIVCNSVVPLVLFARRVRTTEWMLLVVSVLVVIGMWVERFVIIVSSLSHGFLPFAWGSYRPHMVEIGITVGSFGWFFFWFLLFIKLLPAVSISEMKLEVSHGD
jgi:Ni/Fe-hydrogenase subunit HybB-like protein